MKNKHKLNYEELKDSCFKVAKNTMWDRRPVDISNIESVASKFYDIAIQYEYFVLMLGRDPNIIGRAVSYLGLTHAIPPMRDDTRWFSDMLAVLIELACPNTVSSNEIDRFYSDIEEGIASSRVNYSS